MYEIRKFITNSIVIAQNYYFCRLILNLFTLFESSMCAYAFSHSLVSKISREFYTIQRTKQRLRMKNIYTSDWSIFITLGVSYKLWCNWLILIQSNTYHRNQYHHKTLNSVENKKSIKETEHAMRGHQKKHDNIIRSFVTQYRINVKSITAISS